MGLYERVESVVSLIKSGGVKNDQTRTNRTIWMYSFSCPKARKEECNKRIWTT